ncbi:MAG: DJ-1/PfpI family protein [Dehalococcoidia bacterium]
MKTLAAVLFPNFELLDFAGPLEMFGNLKEQVRVLTVAEKAGPVLSVQGVAVTADLSFAECRAADWVLLPGGFGTFPEGANPAMVGFLQRASAAAEQVMTVCSGSGLLARTGVLDGRKATTNKAYFAQCSGEGPAVNWVKEARWVEDGKFATSSGVSAGIDMALAVIAKHFGEPVAEQLALLTEYEWHRDPAWDPFAKAHGLAG